MKVALIWNGDKDSVLMYGKVKEKFDISFLLTFLQGEPSRTNYLSTIIRQSRKLGVPFFWTKVDASYLEECKETIAELKKDYGIEGIVTDETHTSWIEYACNAAGVEVIRV
jgi:diphthamide synthase (EF-2-diphthine--ammonia ligase)